MRINAWATRLELFKRQEKPETVLMVVGSAELMRIAVAWSGTPVARKSRLSVCKGEEPDTVWRWLWSNVDYSRTEFIQRIPGASEGTEQKFAALVASHVLYPDGTVNSFVERYLKERVINLFGLQRRAHKIGC